MPGLRTVSLEAQGNCLILSPQVRVNGRSSSEALFISISLPQSNSNRP
jgi:hypothetical protein